MSDDQSEGFDFIRGFVGVDLLAVEAVARVVARTQATMFREMVEAGVDKVDAFTIMSKTMSALVSEVMRAVREMNEGKGA